MITSELLLKTAFCCMACDGDIAPEEISTLNEFALNSQSFKDIDIQNTINGYVIAINDKKGSFLTEYLSEVKNANLDDDSSLRLVDIAIKMIEADNVIEYSEVSFFKRIRNNLNISDDILYEKMPDKEDYFLPDIKRPEELEWCGTINSFSL